MARRASATVDWEAVERDYRIGQLTVRQVAQKHGCSVSRMMERQKEEGWTRDLTDAVRVATKSKVREKVIAQVKAAAKASPEQVAEQALADIGTKTEQALCSDIDLAANVNAQIILGQQKRTTRLSTLLEKMTGELEAATDDPQSLEVIALAIMESDPKAAEAILRLRSTTTRMNNLKTASEIMVRVNQEERKAFSIDDDGESEGVESFLERLGREEGIA